MYLKNQYIVATYHLAPIYCIGAENIKTTVQYIYSIFLWNNGGPIYSAAKNKALLY
jgi:hypothetical protein